MNAQNPRDMREYLRILERNSAQMRGIPALIQQNVEIVKEETQKDKERQPAAPVELSAQTALYLDTSSRQRVRFILDFPDVVYNTDGTPAIIQQYELWGREETPSVLHETANSVPSQALPGVTLPGLASTSSNEQIAAEDRPWTVQSTNVQSFFRAEGYIPGALWRFRARALGANTVQPGEWSEEIVVQMLADASPPPQPTAPTVVASRGQLTVTWDGLAVSGAMPPDFSYAILAHGTESSPTFEVARFGRGGGFKVITDIPYYDPQFFRVQAFDESGNGGPWSEQATGYTTPLVDKDLIISKLDAAKTHLKNVDAGVSILPNTIITEHLLVTESMTAAIAEFLVVNADQINVNSLFADEIFTGLLDATVVRADMFEGKVFEGGIFTATKGGRFQTDVEEYRGLKIDATGMLGYSPGGVETLRYEAATGNISIAGGTYTGGKFQTHIDATQGLKLDATGLRGYDPKGVKTFQYLAASGDVSIVGGAFTGGIFQTEAAASRGLKIASTGMQGYSSEGRRTFAFEASTGNVVISGGSIIGAKFETEAGMNNGIKLGPAGLQGYDNNGDLNLDLRSAYARLGGRVTIGFGESQLIMTEDANFGRPGLIFSGASENPYAQRPFIVGYPEVRSGQNPLDRGSLHLSAAQESTGDNPASLKLYRGGGWALQGAMGRIATGTATPGVAVIAGNSSLNLSGDEGRLGVGSSSFRAGQYSGVIMMSSSSRYVKADDSEILMMYTPNLWMKVDGSGASVNGGLTVYGSKNFVMEHPTKKGMELLHGSTESPVSGIEYWGEGTVGARGEGVIVLPDYFEALAKPEGRVVLVLGRGEVLDWSDVVDGKATVYGKPGTKYSWLVKAERFGGDFEVERKAATPPDTAKVTDPLASDTPANAIM